MKAERFRIAVPDEVLNDLKRRLETWREPAGVTHTGGIPLGEMRALMRYWRTSFDWREEEAKLNELPHYRAGDIHFVYARAERDDALPLLLLHGWPGSFLEFLSVIPLLRDFHLVIPSLPGYGFSAVRETGWSNSRIASALAELMSALGFERFGVQGGDWGAGVGTWLAIQYPERVVGLHLNYIPGSYQPPSRDDMTPDERAFLKFCDEWAAESGAYGHIQRTRPLTVAYALSDSPAGLAAWIYEKFVEWADPATMPSLHDIIRNVMLYWVTDSIGTSMRLYLESRATPVALQERVGVPTGILHCAFESPFPPRSWIERGYNVVSWTDSERGGHFAALEVPELFAADVARFFSL